MPATAYTTARLQLLVETAARKFGLPDDLGERIAVEAVAYIVEVYGGTRFYMPIYQHARKARDAAIIAALADGQDPHALAKQHGISIVRVREIGLEGLRRKPSVATAGQ